MRFLRKRLVMGYLALCLTAARAGDAPRATDLRDVAHQAVRDLVTHFWSGDSQTGQIVNTWNGCTTSSPDTRGSLWERAPMFLVLEQAGTLFGDAELKARVAADWQRTKRVYRNDELEGCGTGSRNYASDDAGWSALMYLAAYRTTGDHDALERARGLLNHVFERWLDNELGGGIWYSDRKTEKALYQVAVVLSALRVDELSGNHAFRERAMVCYTWMETHLLRQDGLYWCSYNQDGPVGAKRPGDIKEGGSVVFLGGNMGMAALHAFLYRKMKDDSYLRRALRTVEAVGDHLTREGILLNDRDAWTNGFFAADWATDVLTLPGVSPAAQEILRATARSIAQYARTADGYYGGSWSGPAEGAESRWFAKGSKPQQITTSANSVCMILAAAMAETKK